MDKIEIIKNYNKANEEIILKLEVIFSRIGIPETIICNNMPFNSYKFQFGKEWITENNRKKKKMEQDICLKQ